MNNAGNSRLRPTTVGSMNYHVLRSIIEEYDVLKLNAGVEIGVLYGDTSHFLLRSFPQLTLFGVDPYQPYNEEARSTETMMKFEMLAHHRLAEFGDPSLLLKMTSLEAAVKIPDLTLDFVFIDALHTYEAVRDDVAAWFPKLRPGGLLCGHDISWDGVQRAVGELAEMYNSNINYTPVSSDLWFTFKSTLPGDKMRVCQSEVLRNAAANELSEKYGVRL